MTPITPPVALALVNEPRVDAFHELVVAWHPALDLHSRDLGVKPVVPQDLDL